MFQLLYNLITYQNSVLWDGDLPTLVNRIQLELQHIHTVFAIS